MDSFALLLDSPNDPRKTIQIAKIGDDFEHSSYGQFSIGADDIESWKRNLDHLPGGRALIDEDHSADRTPRRTEASGWITDVRVENGVPVADVDWTSKGEQAIRDKRYLFISPTFGPFTDEHGVTHDNTLIGAALTNRPFLNMGSLCLASEERVSEAIDEDPALRFQTRALDGEYGDVTQALVLLDVSQADRDRAQAAGHSLADGSYPINNAKQLKAAATLAASKHGDYKAAKKLIRRRASDLGVDVSTLPGFAGEGKASLDSRPPMEITTETLKLLDLPEDADEAKVLERVTDLKRTAKDAKKAAKQLDKQPLKTLEQQAKDAGLVLLDSGDVRKLQQKASAGAEAAKQLHQQRFDHVFESALNDPKGARVKPAERKQLYKVYKLDADLAIDMIENREPVVGIGTKPNGDPAISLDQDDVEPATLAAAGVYPGSHELDRKIRKHMLENKLPESQYVTILEQVQTGAVQL